MVIRNIDNRIKYTEEQGSNVTPKSFSTELNKMKSFLVNDERYSVTTLPKPTFYKESTLETVDGNPPIVLQSKQVGKYRILVLDMNPRFNYVTSYFKADGITNIVLAEGCSVNNPSNNTWSTIGVYRGNMNVREYGVIIWETA